MALVAALESYSLSATAPIDAFPHSDAGGWMDSTVGNYVWALEFVAASDGTHPQFTLGNSYDVTFTIATTGETFTGEAVLDDVDPQGPNMDTAEQHISYRYRLVGNGHLQWTFAASPSVAPSDGSSVTIDLTAA